MIVSNIGFAKSIYKKSHSLYYDFSQNERILSASLKSTKHIDLFLSYGMLPIGSAALTSSGALEETGIKGILHAASGSMTRFDGVFKPSIDGVIGSIKNSLRLAKRKRFKSVAIPFIGGGIFLNSIGMSKKELAYNIIKTAIQNMGALELSFIAYSQDDYELFQTEYQTVLSEESRFSRYSNQILFRLPVKQRSNVLRGSITDFALHNRELIVNAANTELSFGGGLSGFIGRKTQESTQIDNDCQSIIQKIQGLRD